MPKKIAILFTIVLFPIVLAAETYKLVPKAGKNYEIKEGKIFFRAGNAGLVLQPADVETISRYYRERGFQEANPFPQLGPEFSGDATWVFLLTLFNRTNGHLTFTPRYVTMRIKTEAFFPLDFTVLLSPLERLEPYTKKTLQDSIYHSPELVQSGEVVSKFLIFPAVPKKHKELRLDFDYLYFEEKEVKCNFYFHVLKEKIPN